MALNLCRACLLSQEHLFALTDHQGFTSVSSLQRQVIPTLYSVISAGFEGDAGMQSSAVQTPSAKKNEVTKRHSHERLASDALCRDACFPDRGCI